MRESAILTELTPVARGSTPGRRTLVCRRRSEGRELLRSLALGQGGWLGWEVVTPLELASRIVAADLASERRRVADEFDQRALLESAIDDALDSGNDDALSPLTERSGLRDALVEAVKALRFGGIRAGRLRDARLSDPARQRVLVRILDRYVEGLEEARRCDAADIFRRAAGRLEGEGGAPIDALYLLPDQSLRGVRGRFLRLLEANGGHVLATDPVLGIERPPALLRGPEREVRGRLSLLHAPGTSGRAASAGGRGPEMASGAGAGPEIELFAAVSPSDEIREVLRRVLDSGRRWDEVEVIASDAVAYGCALDALASRRGIEVTYATGLPFRRTRQGRAVEAYLRWIERDFPAEPIWRLLRSGTLAAPEGDGGPEASGARLARRLRGLRIGWGRDRYLPRIEGALERVRGGGGQSEGSDGRPMPEERVRAREREELAVLRDFFRRVLRATPDIPERPDSAASAVSPADLASGLRAFLEFVPAESEPEQEARGRLDRRLERIAETLTRGTSLVAAMSLVRSGLEIRVPPPAADGTLPWGSAGGCLHFSDLEHGGFTARPLTFVVGLDAGRFPGAGLQDAILPDRDRRALGAGTVPTAADRLREKRYRLAALLARLRGRVTLSYSSWESSEGRTVAPASVLLQALRLRRNDPTADFDRLHRELGRPASPVPRSGGRLDARDVWLDTIRREGRFLSARPAVREGFPRLESGRRAKESRKRPEVSVHTGKIRPRPDRLDPRDHPSEVLSASRLELLGRCPLAYFYRYVLGISPPEDPGLDPGAWLDPRDRGRLLHRVFEETLRRSAGSAAGREDGDVPADGDGPARGEDLSVLAGEVLEGEAERMRRLVPPPGDYVFRAELARLRADVSAFVEMVRSDAPRPWKLELLFGTGRSEHPPASLELPGGTIRFSGRIDRVDRGEAGELRVVDYKTGRPWGHDGDDPFRGGRRLQHLLYLRAAEELLGGETRAMEYHYPTVRGATESVSYSRSDLAGGPDLLDELLEHTRRGEFFPTDDASDCRFCDFRKICRVSVTEYGEVQSPPAAWAAEHGPDLEAYRPFRDRRGRDE